MLGNVVVGMTILGPAGMLAELATGLGVGIHDTGLLVTYGAVVLCIGSPVMAWLTTRIDRRVLLVVTLAVLAVGQGASALTSNYSLILLLRVIMLAIGALYTPQAATTVALIVPDRERPSAIAFVFLGWSIAIAGGLPLLTFVASNFGWQAVYGALAVFAVIIAALLFAALPKGLRGGAALAAKLHRHRREQAHHAHSAGDTAANVRAIRHFRLSGSAAQRIDWRRRSDYWRLFRILWRGWADRQRRRKQHRDGARNPENAGGVSWLNASRIDSVVGRRRLVAGHGSRHIFLGVRIFRSQFPATGASGRGRAGSRQRVSRAQHVPALCRTSHRVRHRRTFVRPRIFSVYRLCGCRFCCSCMRGSCGFPGTMLPEAKRMRGRTSRISSLAKLFTVVKMRDRRSNEVAKRKPHGPHPFRFRRPEARRRIARHSNGQSHRRCTSPFVGGADLGRGSLLRRAGECIARA